jgi:hypothetical protein
MYKTKKGITFLCFFVFRKGIVGQLKEYYGLCLLQILIYPGQVSYIFSLKYLFVYQSQEDDNEAQDLLNKSTSLSTCMYFHLSCLKTILVELVWYLLFTVICLLKTCLHLKRKFTLIFLAYIPTVWK